MLQAKMQNGKLITLANIPRNKVEELRQQQFYCPSCSNPVMMKVGSKMIPHFSHYADQNCLLQERGEGMYHERGKLLIYNWLKSQQLDARLEAYLPKAGQRPDVFLTINNKKIAIEYQCARIPIEQVNKRSIGYKKEGIIPIWILGANRLLRITSTHFRIDQFTLQFIQQYSSKQPLLLFYFCPHTLKFIIIQDIFITSHGSAIGKINVLDMKHTIFTNLFSTDWFTRQDLFYLWKKEKERFRMKPRGKAYGNELAWRKWLYRKGTHIEYLPSSIYLPISSQYKCKLSPWNWQSRIYLEIIEKIPIGSTFSVKACEHLLKNQIQPSSYFPLIHSIDNPILMYLSHLERLNIIKQITPLSFRKQVSVIHYQNVEEAIHGDEQTLKQLFT